MKEIDWRGLCLCADRQQRGACEIQEIDEKTVRDEERP